MQSTIRFCATHLLCLALCVTASAQQSPEQSGGALNRSDAAPAAQTSPLLLPKGTPVEFFLLEGLSSATAKKGQIVRLAVAKDVSVDGVVVIPKGTPTEGKVATVHKGIPGKRVGEIDVRATGVPLGNGQRLRLQEYAPGEDGCGDMVHCWVWPIAAVPLAPIVLAGVVLVSPITLGLYIDERRHPSKEVLASTQMTLPLCRRVNAYTSRKAVIQLAGPPPAEPAPVQSAPAELAPAEAAVLPAAVPPTCAASK
jgi:hypothetical protein